MKNKIQVKVSPTSGDLEIITLLLMMNHHIKHVVDICGENTDLGLINKEKIRDFFLHSAKSIFRNKISIENFEYLADMVVNEYSANIGNPYNQNKNMNMVISTDKYIKAFYISEDGDWLTVPLSNNALFVRGGLIPKHIETIIIESDELGSSEVTLTFEFEDTVEEIYTIHEREIEILYKFAKNNNTSLDQVVSYATSCLLSTLFGESI